MSFSNVLNFLVIAIEVLIIFNLIIIVHELGHFLAARWRGLVVEEFGVWFGKPLWRKKIGDVWYSVGSIPAGGFVKLPQMAPMETLEGESEKPVSEMPPVKPLDKIICAIAGPIFSFLLALFMATLVWIIGKPVNQIEKTTVIGYVKEGGPADRAGLKVGDKILTVDGEKVDKFFGALNSVTWRIIRSEGATIPFEVERNGKVEKFESGWDREETASWKRKSLRKVFIGPRILPQVGKVTPNSPAAQAGLQPGDIMIAAAGQETFNLDEFLEAAEANIGKTLPITVERGGQRFESSIVPAAAGKGKEELGPELGVQWGLTTLDHPGPWQQVVDGVTTIGNMLGALFSPKSDVKVQHFSGPVGIMRVYYALFEAEEGWRAAIAFSVFFNVNLALLNMLPFPVLDGGHILLAGIEAIRRKPLHSRAVEIVQTAFALALIGFMLYVTFFDVGDLVPHKPRSEPAAAEQAKPAPPEVKAAD